MAKKVFQTEIKQLLDLMIHSLYSNKEIFLRELISNSNDALDKLQFLSISDDKYKSIEFNPKITISFDENANTISIEDNGIGMDEGDLEANLGTIAKSGTKAFLDSIKDSKDKKNSNLIGQFGVGFYSSFMVASNVVVQSKKAAQDKSFSWVSNGDGEYEILESSWDGLGDFGTKITLYLNDDSKEFVSRYKLEEIIKRYSNNIAYPIFLSYQEEVKKQEEDSKEDDSKDKKEESLEVVQKNEQINSAKALWLVSKSSLQKQDYEDFYKTLGHDMESPLSYIHTQVEGNLEYKSLFFIPKNPPFDMNRADYKSGVKLYVKRVFITDDDRELLPQYLRFVKGIIDSDDLPLNVSREILQQNKILANIKSASTKKILGMIKDLQKDSDVYADFYAKYGNVLKEGLYSDFENKDRLLELLRAYSIKNSKDISLKDYKEGFKENQTAIFYTIGKNLDLAKNNPLLEKFSDFDVLIFSEEIDSLIIPSIQEFDGAKLIDISSKEANDLLGIKEIDEAKKEEFAKLVEIFKKDSLIADVSLSTSLSSPMALVEDSSNAMMANLMRQMGQSVPDAKKNLEINISHPLIVKINELQDEDKKQKYAKILLDGALILEGQNIGNAKSYIDNINELLLNALN